MNFDLDKKRKEREPLSLTLDGKTYTACFSADCTAHFLKAMDAANTIMQSDKNEDACKLPNIFVDGLLAIFIGEGMAEILKAVEYQDLVLIWNAAVSRISGGNIKAPEATDTAANDEAEPEDENPT